MKAEFSALSPEQKSKSGIWWIPLIFQNAKDISDIKYDIKQINEGIKQIANNVQQNIKEIEQISNQHVG